MHAVVLAAGEGTRMRPVTETRPKPMLPVAGKPLLEHVLDACVPHVDGFVIVVGYRADVVRDQFGRNYRGVPITYVTQNNQLGTGHAIDRAKPHVDGPFLALNGDVIINSDLVAGLTTIDPPAMAVKPIDNPSEYGVIAHDGDRVTTIVEKPTDPPSTLANLGIYTFSPDVFDHIDEIELSPRGEYEITDALQSIADEQPLHFLEYDGYWLDVGRPWELLDANECLLTSLDHRLAGDIEDGATIHGPVVLEGDARVRSGAYIEGPVIIQAGADVGPNTYVRGSTVIGPDVRVGNAVEIKNSILMARTNVGHLSYVGDSVLGQDVNFGAGTTVANLRHDDQTIKTDVKGDSIDTGRRKLGVLVGDGTKTGINTSLNAGVVLGTETTTAPGEIVMSDKGRRSSTEGS